MYRICLLDVKHVHDKIFALVRQALEYKHLYMPTYKMLSIFSSHGYNKSSMLEVGQVREVVTTYIRSNDLVAKDNPRFDFTCEENTYRCTHVHMYIITNTGTCSCLHICVHVSL